MARKRKGGKWSNRSDIPAEKVELTPWMQKALAAKDERQSKTMDELAQEWEDLEAQDRIAEDAQSARNIIYKALELRILEEAEKIKMAAGTDMWRDPTGKNGTFSPKPSPTAVITDKGALMKWIHDTGQEDRLTLPKPIVDSIIREAFDTEIAAMLSPAARAELQPGEPGSCACPPGVEAYMRTTVHHTSPNRKSANSQGAEDDGE